MTPETGSRLSSADASTAGGTFAVAPAHQPPAAARRARSTPARRSRRSAAPLGPPA